MPASLHAVALHGKQVRRLLSLNEPIFEPHDVGEFLLGRRGPAAARVFLQCDEGMIDYRSRLSNCKVGCKL